MVDVLARIHEMNADRRLKPASEWNDPAFTQIWSNAEQPPFLHGDEPIPRDCERVRKRERELDVDDPFVQRDRKRFKHARPGSLRHPRNHRNLVALRITQSGHHSFMLMNTFHLQVIQVESATEKGKETVVAEKEICSQDAALVIAVGKVGENENVHLTRFLPL
ncbi:hypothetical protein E1B28_010881 [Marasmius oreades]|uniref:Uncharacterized protein n=1 Tax=Marasmius oreades TaxID=181124 RepID=A0A9P7URH5_9AGAR|nr:uncharacterized protein E1B28_010881 [Marasmius oreades]KAG7089179.1 hypothetical protein E1B28_010881 [Marasmius oreades]